MPPNTPSPSVKRGARDARRFARTLLGLEPRLYYPIEGRVRPRHRALFVDEATDLVLEGYARSGNTFAVAAFRSAQPTPLRIAHHLHVPAQIVAAARLNKPAVVLVRHPDENVLSHAVFTEDLSLQSILLGYTLFYRRVLPLRSHFVLATFEQCTQDFGAVVDRVNARFGTHFASFSHEAEEAVMEGMQERAVAREGENWTVMSSVPTAERKARKEQCRAELASPSVQPFRRAALRTYETLLASKGP